MTLIKRLEAAEQGSRELDTLVRAKLEDLEVRWKIDRVNDDGTTTKIPMLYKDGKPASYSQSPVTTDLSASVALAEKTAPDLVATILQSAVRRWAFLEGKNASAKLPLYIVIALLKALETKEGGA